MNLKSFLIPHTYDLKSNCIFTYKYNYYETLTDVNEACLKTTDVSNINDQFKKNWSCLSIKIPNLCYHNGKNVDEDISNSNLV